MDDRIRLVVKGETALARRIALAVLTTRPVSVGGSLIPGKFLFDFLKRLREVRWSIDRYLPPRRHALEEARRRIEGGEPAAFEDDPHSRLVAGLVEHYGKLLRAEGGTFGEMVRSAWSGRAEYVAETRRIAALESELDDAAVMARGGDPVLRVKLDEYREHAADQRRRFAGEIYL